MPLSFILAVAACSYLAVETEVVPWTTPGFWTAAGLAILSGAKLSPRAFDLPRVLIVSASSTSHSGLNRSLQTR